MQCSVSVVSLSLSVSVSVVCVCVCVCLMGFNVCENVSGHVHDTHTHVLTAQVKLASSWIGSCLLACAAGKSYPWCVSLINCIHTHTHTQHNTHTFLLACAAGKYPWCVLVLSFRNCVSDPAFTASFFSIARDLLRLTLQRVSMFLSLPYTHTHTYTTHTHTLTKYIALWLQVPPDPMFYSPYSGTDSNAGAHQ